jgi:putative MFS transporter
MDQAVSSADRTMTAAGDFSSAVAARIDALPDSFGRYWAPLLLGLIMFGETWDTILLSFIMPGIRQEWSVGLVETGAMLTLAAAGSVVGSFILGPAAEKLGRRPVLVASVLAVGICVLASALTRDLKVFFGLRAVQGFCMGGALPACMAYVNELAPTPTRGRYFSIFQFMMTAGAPAVSISSPFLIPAFGWRIMLFLGLMPALVVPLVLLTLPESPRWLASRGRRAAANKALARLGAPPAPEDLPVVKRDKTRVPWLVLFTPKYRNKTISLNVLWLCAALVSGAFTSWLPTVYVHVYQIPQKLALQYVAIPGIIYIFVPLLFALIIDSAGRRRPAAVAATLSLACLLILAVTNVRDTPLLVGLITVAWVSAAACGTVMLHPYTAESYPTEMRATGYGFAATLGRFGSMAVPLVVGGTLAATGSATGVYWMMTVCMVVVTAFWWFFAHETAGKSAEQI